MPDMPTTIAALLMMTLAGSSPLAAGTPTVDAEAIHRLLIKEEIRDTLAHYNQLVDRDDGAPTRHEWATRMFTDDAEMLAYFPDGKPDVDLHGRAAIEQRFGGGEAGESGLASKHYIVNIVFDDVTDTQVRTHINALSVTTTKTIVDRHCPGCGNQPVAISMFVYDDTWRKVNGEWRISRMSVQFRN